MQNTLMAHGLVDDTFQAFLVQDATFTSTEEYPVIRPDMISSTLPQKIMPFSKAINFRGDLSNTFVCFYSPDDTFERVRRNPKKYVDFFRRTAGIIGFDFSIHSDMPIVKQKAQINDNLSLSFYFGNQGIPLIPNLRCGDNELLDEFLAAIPHNKPVAIGTHGFCKKVHEKCEWYCFIEQVVDKIHPSVVIVYGSLRGDIFNSLKGKTSFVYFDSWITERCREAKRYVD